MTTPSPEPAQRVGDAERQSAIAALGDHWRAGRLDPGEHEARTTKAFGAVTRGDLDALFVDLPRDAAATPATSSAQAGAPAGVSLTKPAAAPMPSSSSGGGFVPEGSWVHRKRDAIMGVTPFAATGLFFVTGGHFWEFFLVIPAMGALLYAGDDGGKQRHRERDLRRDEERERRRLDRGH